MRVRVWCRADAEGGAGGYARSLIGGLRARGHEVRVGPRRRSGEVVVSLERRAGADIWRAGGGVHRIARQRSLRAPRVPGLGWTRWFDRELWRERQAARTAKVVVANSELVARQLVRSLGVPPVRVEVVRTGVDLQRFRPMREATGHSEEDRDHRRVLFAAHGWRRKGFSTAVEAFERVARPGDELWVAGRDGRRIRRLTAARAHLGGQFGTTSRSTLVDVGRSPDLAAVLPLVDAVLHPTRYDAASNLVLEALACGVPIVTTRWDGSAEVLPDPGLVVQDPTDAAQVAAGLMHALDRSGETAVWRGVAETWPESRNHDRMDEVVRRTRTWNG